jgi:dienelactone hydrolase
MLSAVATIALATGCANAPELRTSAGEVTVRGPASLAALPDSIDGARRIELQRSTSGGRRAATVVAWLFEPRDAPAPRPAVVALHGCGGLYDRQGELSARHRMAVRRLLDRGFIVLMPDSFGSRGLREICSTRYTDRLIDIGERRLDARAALEHLSTRSNVQANRIALLGWSNGATAVLATIDAAAAPPAKRPTDAGRPAFARAIAFYPGCSAALQQRLQPSVPVLLLLGAEDDWTPARPCLRWAEQARAPGGPAIEVEVYAGAHHGFDGPGSTPVRRTDVPHAPDGRGVTTGGHPEARRLSWQRVEVWLEGLLGD